jgi:hypothetical protein
MAYTNDGASVFSAATDTRSSASGSQSVTFVSGREYLVNYSGWSTAQNASTDVVQYGIVELRNVTDNVTLDSTLVSHEGNQASRSRGFSGTHVIAGLSGTKTIALYVTRKTPTAGTRIDILDTALNIVDIGA